MPHLGDNEKITSTLYSQIVREQDDATMEMLENYVKEKMWRNMFIKFNR